MIKFFILIGLLLFACDPRVPGGGPRQVTAPINLPSSGPYLPPTVPSSENEKNKSTNKEAQEAQESASTKFPLKGDIGIVECQNMEQEMNSFNDSLKEFLSTTEDISKMDWWVKCSNQRPDFKGGVFIKGNVIFKGGARFSPSSDELEVSSNSYLEIHLIDIYGKNIKSISMNAAPYQIIEGNHINLTFNDQHGSLDMSGRVERGVFSGVLNFENRTSYAGDRRNYSGRIGFFRILACNFFRCER